MLTQIVVSSDMAGGHAQGTLGEHGGMGIQASTSKKIVFLIC